MVCFSVCMPKKVRTGKLKYHSQIIEESPYDSKRAGQDTV